MGDSRSGGQEHRHAVAFVAHRAGIYSPMVDVLRDRGWPRAELGRRGIAVGLGDTHALPFLNAWPVPAASTWSWLDTDGKGR
jgi:hypothetical protein